jgi:uncharacterized protein YcbK (DUF882 family)
MKRAMLPLLLALTISQAAAQTRALHIKHRHTGEEERIVFKNGGSYDSAGLKKLNWMLRDWRTDEPRDMDPELFDIIYEVYTKLGASEPINVVSAYRSPGTNAALRRRSRGVARNSQHIQGKALDFYIPGVSTIAIREAALKMERGGVGFYPRAGTAFIHVDSGSVRHWPKMSRDQLARVFPDGKTVHIPRDGKPMGGFDVALASLQKRGGTFSRTGGGEDNDEPEAKGGDGGRFLAFLRGGRPENTRPENTRPENTRPEPKPPVLVAAAPVIAPKVAEVEEDEKPEAQKPEAQKPVIPVRLASFQAPLPIAPPRELEMMRKQLALNDKTQGDKITGDKITIATAPLPVPRPTIPETLPFKTIEQANSSIILAAPLPQADPRKKAIVAAIALPVAKEVAKEPVKILPTSFGKQLQALNPTSLTGNMGFGFNKR